MKTKKIDVADRIGTSLWAVGIALLINLGKGAITVGPRGGGGYKIPAEYTEYVCWAAWIVAFIFVARIFTAMISNSRSEEFGTDENDNLGS